MQDRKREEIIKDLIEIQEDLDEINEKIDIISQKTTELLEVKNEERSGEIAEIIEIEEGLDEVEEPEEEDLSEESEQVEMGQEEIGQNFCKNTLGGYPKRDKVIINEIAWMGTSNSANDEWVELKNISGRSINLEGWQLQDGDGQIKIIFNKDSIISADGFYLLERTDDYSVPTIIADFIYTGSLNDKEESLYLFNENCGLEDEVKAIPDWLAGDKLNKRSTERNKSFAWYTYYGPGQDNILGTPKGENSVVPFYSGGGGIVSSLFSDLSKSPSSPEILITEIQIEGKESFYDFIEFYNFATSSLNISGFQLKKKTSFGKEYSIRVFPEGSIVLSQDYFLWLSSEYASSSQVSADVTSSQSLAKNNSIALFDREENILDAVAWGSSTNPFVENVPFFQNPEEGQSLARKWDETNKKYKDINNNHEDFEIQIPTPRIQNQSPQPPQNQLPIAQFFYFPTNPTVNQGIIFDAASSTDPDGTIVGYIWDFGDNATSSFIEATTTYVYSTSGDFLVNLIIIDNNNATDSTTTTVTVSIPTPTLEVVINEIAWMGTRTDDSDEWIELYNNTDEEINLEGWKIKAADNTPEVNLIGVIPSKGYFLLERTDDQTISDIGVDQIYTGALENEGERLELKDDEGNLIDLIDCLSGWFVGRNQKIEENWVRMSMERIRPEMQGEGLSNWITNNGFTISGRDSNNIPIQGTPKNQNSGYNFSETFLISPDVLQDTILTQESSPYVVKGTLTILENINLFIEPGVKIRFVPEYQSGIKAKGTIKAIGEEGNPIVFTSNFGATPGSWETLRFIGPDSILDNVVVRYGGYYFYIPSVPPVVRGAILVEGTDVTIKNSVIENNLVAGVWLNSSNSLIENTIFRNNNQEYHYVPREPGMGITAALFLEGTSSPTLNNLTFEGNAVNIYPTP